LNGVLVRIFLLALLLNAPLSLWADEPVRPQSKDEIRFRKEQAHYKLANAKVAWADYSALRRDFTVLTTMSNDEIDKWIIDNFAYVSGLQLKLQDIRVSQIPLAKDAGGGFIAKKFGHPLSYHRASVAPANYNSQSIGLVDLKGSGQSHHGSVQKQIDSFSQLSAEATDARLAGLNQLRTRDHSDGVMSLGEAVQEVTKQRALQMEFDIVNAATGSSYETVENYFIIDQGYDILKKDDETVPAGMIGRQAHWRGSKRIKIPDKLYTDPFGAKQGTIFESAVDFGGVILSDPKLAENYSPLPGANPRDPQGHKPWAHGHDAARNFRNGDVNAVRGHVDYMVSPIKSDWEKAVVLKKSLQLRQAHAMTKGFSLEILDELPKQRTMEFLEAVHAAHMNPDGFSKKELADLGFDYTKLLKRFVKDPSLWKDLSSVKQAELLQMNADMIQKFSGQPKTLPLIALQETLLSRVPSSERAKFRTYSSGAAKVCSFTNKITGWLGL
jgi:hypothetical protein